MEVFYLSALGGFLTIYGFLVWKNDLVRKLPGRNVNLKKTKQTSVFTGLYLIFIGIGIAVCSYFALKLNKVDIFVPFVVVSIVFMLALVAHVTIVHPKKNSSV